MILFMLSQMCHEHYDQPVIIHLKTLIYDTGICSTNSANVDLGYKHNDNI